MTSQKQTDANRRNALLSTGPRSEGGKQHSRGNAYRHGLTAETVIVGIEDAADYDAFESEIVAEYDPKSVIERELTRRLASLLWRLRRANLIEAGLLRFSEIIKETDSHADFGPKSLPQVSNALIRRLKLTSNDFAQDHKHNTNLRDQSENESQSDFSAHARGDKQYAITSHYLRLANLGSLPLERISRYETGLWRQFVQVLFSLDQARYHRIATSRGRFIPRTPQW